MNQSSHIHTIPLQCRKQAISSIFKCATCHIGILHPINQAHMKLLLFATKTHRSSHKKMTHIWEQIVWRADNEFQDQQSNRLQRGLRSESMKKIRKSIENNPSCLFIFREEGIAHICIPMSECLQVKACRGILRLRSRIS